MCEWSSEVEISNNKFLVYNGRDGAHWQLWTPLMIVSKKLKIIFAKIVSRHIWVKEVWVNTLTSKKSDLEACLIGRQNTIVYRNRLEPWRTQTCPPNLNLEKAPLDSTSLWKRYFKLAVPVAVSIMYCPSDLMDPEGPLILGSSKGLTGGVSSDRIRSPRGRLHAVELDDQAGDSFVSVDSLRFASKTITITPSTAQPFSRESRNSQVQLPSLGYQF